VNLVGIPEVLTAKIGGQAWGEDLQLGLKDGD